MRDVEERPTGWGGVPVRPPELPEFHAAAQRIKGKTVRTPLIPLHSYEGVTDTLLKPEVHQPIGSFKLRGVLNWAMCLSEEERARGLSTFSAGNTAQALGYVARLFGVSARSLLPDKTPRIKVEAIQSYDVTPIRMPFNDLLNYVFEARWKQEPYSFLNPWADPMMIAGSGTIGLEIITDLPDVDTVYVPVGGGGLISGVGSVLRALKPSVRVVGVQPEACPSLLSSFKAGKPMWVDVQPTICDTAVPVVVNEMYPLLRQVVDDVVLVSEEAVRAAVKQLAVGNKLIIEGSGAMSLAAAIATPAHERGKTVCVLSGGNIDIDKLIAILTEAET